MQESEIAVKFQPSGKTAFVLTGTRLHEAAAEAGLVLEQPCGGQGLCGKCRVIVHEGAAEPTPVEQRFFSAQQLAAGWRLACQTPVLQPTVAEVPAEALVGNVHKILTQAASHSAAGGDRPVRKQYLQMLPPRRGSDEPDLVRLRNALENQALANQGSGNHRALSVPLDLLRELPARLRQTNFCGTAVLAAGRLLDFQPGDTTAACYAVATDVGTTTLVSALLDMITGEELAVAAQLNPQTRYGDDVLSRIVFARDNPHGLAQLQQCVVAAIDQLIGQLCSQAGLRRSEIYQLTFSGNTTMEHLLCAIDPQHLAVVPFVPVLGPALELAAAELGFNVHPRARAYLMPVIGGFVGGDTVAGILATGLASAERPTLLVDIGTNGEIVLCAGGKLWAASTAAGPAFEGARISRGMRGSVGAIEKVVFDGRLRINVIGNVRPTGLCGSGLIDAAAELLRHGLLAPSGKLLPRRRLPADVPADLARRVVEQDGQPAFMLASEEETADAQPILLTQHDIRQLQLATGAIRTGITLLLRRAGLHPEQLHAVLLAGGFGNFIRRSNAQRIGLLPPQIQRQRIRYQGNTSLAGARLVALSLQARQLAEQIARQVEHVDLSADQEFHNTFASSMTFPES
jgi:uncharacterized 2Fe-2S/4Fe-4S cluster protein (DUF4445 family)